MTNKLVMRLIIEEQEVLFIEGTKKGRKVNWERMKEGSRYFPPFLMRKKNIGKTYEALTEYVDNLQERKIIPKQDYKIVIDTKVE